MLSNPLLSSSAGSRSVGVDVEIEQVADGVAVLGAVQAVERACGPGWAAPARRAIERLSSDVTKASSVAASGRGMPCGGIMPPCSFLHDLLPDLGASAASAEFASCRATGRRSSARSLWQVTQYFWTSAPSGGEAGRSLLQERACPGRGGDA